MLHFRSQAKKVMWFFQNTAMHLAACSGHLELLQYLERKGIGLNEKNNDGVSFHC